MNPERIQGDVEAVIRDYVTKRKSKEGTLTIVSEADKRIDELAALITERVITHDDRRARLLLEAKQLQMGDVFTRYAIKENVGVDEEVTVVRVETKTNRTTLKYRRHNDSHGELTLDATFLVSVNRPTLEDLKRDFAAGDV